MNDMIKAMEGFIKASNETYANWPYKTRSNNKWTECYHLWKTGWKMEDCLGIENKDDIIVRWVKGENKKEITLSFSDQLVWLEFLERQEKINEQQ